jgi:Imidazolonepropionase and related amidohydrolases
MMKSFATKLWLLVVILLALVAAATAQATGKRTVIHAGKLLDVKTGKIETNQAIIIQGDKIISVGPVSAAQPSGDDRVIDLPNATVLPGPHRRAYAPDFRSSFWI